jgi:tetratricopeptide (TPR) repeat protein
VAKPAKEPEVADEPPEAEDEPLEIIEGDDEGAEPEDSKSTKGPKRKHRRKANPDALLGEAERDPAKAADLAKQGVSAYRAGQRGKAASLFNQAIAFDRGNTTALMGLSDIYFDQGKNQKAVVYAERAVKASPSNRSYRIKLGDAYYKVLRYKDALTQYEKAKSLGATKAKARIEKVKSKLGG